MSPPTTFLNTRLQSSALQQSIATQQPEAPQPQVNNYQPHQLASTISPSPTPLPTRPMSSALEQSVVRRQLEAPQPQVNDQYTRGEYQWLPAELQALIQTYVAASDDGRPIEALSLVVSREYMRMATLVPNFTFLFNSENFEQGNVKRETRCFAEYMGHMVRCLVFSTWDIAIAELPGHLEELLGLFPNVTEVRLVDVTRRKLGIGEHATHSTGRPSMMQDMARGVTWDQVMNWYHSNARMPFEWLRPILKRALYRAPPLPSGGQITKFSIEWFDGEEKKNSLTWGPDKSIVTDITHVLPALVNLMLARHHPLSDAELQSLRWSSDSISSESVYRLGELMRMRLQEGEIVDADKWDDGMEECLLLEDQYEYDAEEEHLAVREILDDIWELRQQMEE